MTTESGPSKVIDGELVEESNAAFAITINQSTGKEIVRVGIPQSFDEWTPLQRAAILKSTPTWAGYEIPQLMFFDAWANKHNLDLFSGRVYIVDGKPATDDEAKIANARRSGRIEKLTVSEIVKATNPLTGANDFYAEARLKLKGEDELVYRAWMSEWRNLKNANWTQRPTDSLQRKALARVCHFGVPMSSDGDDFVAAPTDSLGTPLGKAVAEQLEAIPSVTGRELEAAIKQ